MTLLLTGFEPFGSVRDNPSQRIVEHIEKQDHSHIITTILPVRYQDAGEKLLKLIEKHQPTCILMLGVAQTRDKICLERIALNINSASLADNDGNVKSGEYIEHDSPLAYESTLPLFELNRLLRKKQIPTRISYHAGTYLCNHIFYTARHYLETSNQSHVPCGFVHIPQAGDNAPNMPLSKMTYAIEQIVDYLSETIN